MSHVKQSLEDCRDPTKPHLTLISFPHLQKATLERFVHAREAFMSVLFSWYRKASSHCMVRARQQKQICFLCNHKDLLDQTHKRWGENWARTHQCLAQNASSPKFCFSLPPAVQPTLIHSQCSAKTFLVYRNTLLLYCYFARELLKPLKCSAAHPLFFFLLFLFWDTVESHWLMSSSLGQQHKTKTFNCCIFLMCRTELGGVNKSHFPSVVLQLKCSISCKNCNPEQSSS